MSKVKPTSSSSPQLRPSNVPWLDLEEAIMESVALNQLVSDRLAQSTSEAEPRLEGDAASGLICLSHRVNNNLRAAFNHAMDSHTEERKSP